MPIRSCKRGRKYIWRRERSCKSICGNRNSTTSPLCMVLRNSRCVNPSLQLNLKYCLFSLSQSMSNQHPSTRRKPFSLAEPGDTVKRFRCLLRVLTLRQQRPSASGLHRAETPSSGRPCFSPCSKYTWTPRTSSGPPWICSVTILRSFERSRSSSFCLIPGLFSLCPSSYLDPLERLCTGGEWQCCRRRWPRHNSCGKRACGWVGQRVWHFSFCSSEHCGSRCKVLSLPASPRQMQASKTKIGLNKGQACDVCQKEFAEPQFCCLHGYVTHLDCAGS